jgi:vancomycin resistance protein YoaR
LLELDASSRDPRFRLRDPEPEPPKANELVSSFTTRYPAREPRVVNIRLAARLDGTVLVPGQTFSMNTALGQRTVERDF